MLKWITLIGAAVCLLGGLFFVVSAVVGNFKFKFVLNRMHAAAMVDTLGIFLFMLGLILLNGLSVASVKMVLIVVFLWISSPVSSHLLARMEVTTDEEIKRECEVIQE